MTTPMKHPTRFYKTRNFWLITFFAPLAIAIFVAGMRCG